MSNDLELDVLYSNFIAARNDGKDVTDQEWNDLHEYQARLDIAIITRKFLAKTYNSIPEELDHSILKQRVKERLELVTGEYQDIRRSYKDFLTWPRNLKA